MPAAASPWTPRLPRPLLRMNAPAEIRGAISGTVIGRPNIRTPLAGRRGTGAGIAPDPRPVPSDRPVNRASATPARPTRERRRRVRAGARGELGAGARRTGGLRRPTGRRSARAAALGRAAGRASAGTAATATAGAGRLLLRGGGR